MCEGQALTSGLLPEADERQNGLWVDACVGLRARQPIDDCTHAWLRRASCKCGKDRHCHAARRVFDKSLTQLLQTKTATSTGIWACSKHEVFSDSLVPVCTYDAEKLQSIFTACYIQVVLTEMLAAHRSWSQWRSPLCRRPHTRMQAAWPPPCLLCRACARG